MMVYCVSKNGDHDHIRQVYLGTSIIEAVDSIGEFEKYRRPKTKYPKRPQLYSSIPTDIERKMVAFFMNDGRWYSIVKFDLY